MQCQFSYLIALNMERFLVVSNTTCRNLVLVLFWHIFGSRSFHRARVLKVRLFIHVVSAVPLKESYVKMRHNSNSWNTVIHRLHHSALLLFYVLNIIFIVNEGRRLSVWQILKLNILNKDAKQIFGIQIAHFLYICTFLPKISDCKTSSLSDFAEMQK